MDRWELTFARGIMHVLLVQHIDPDGMCRAWAADECEEEAYREADRQLGLYRTKKAALNDPLAYADYTVETEYVNLAKE
jgi:hypothetical protein